MSPSVSSSPVVCRAGDRRPIAAPRRSYVGGALFLAQGAWGAPVELPQGPALASIRVRAMGGVCTSLAESATCQLTQPAAVVVRRPEDDDDRSIDATLQAPLHPVFRAVFGGPEPDPPALRLRDQVGINAKLREFGAGLHLRQDGFATDHGKVLASTWALPLAWSESEWAIGCAPVLTAWHVSEGIALGGGATAGVLFAPDGSGWRVGVSGATPVRTGSVEGAALEALRSPSRVTFGVGYGFGLAHAARDHWTDRVRTHPDAPYLQVFSELELVGGSADAVPLAGGRPAGDRVLARVGGEADLLRQHLRLRGGAYHEVRPDADAAIVPHLTAGATVHLFSWLQGTRWRAGGVMDWAPGAPGFGFGLETW